MEVWFGDVQLHGSGPWAGKGFESVPQGLILATFGSNLVTRGSFWLLLGPGPEKAQICSPLARFGYFWTPGPEKGQIWSPEAHFGHFWALGQKRLKSDHQGLVLITFGHWARKGSNLITRGSF